METHFSLNQVLLMALALLNLYPGIVAFFPARSKWLYGVTLEGSALSLAMRHRAVLLALVGVLFGFSAFDEAWLRPALFVGFVSKITFLVLFALTRPHETPMRRVAIADVIAIAVLAAVAATSNVLSTP